MVKFYRKFHCWIIELFMERVISGDTRIQYSYDVKSNGLTPCIHPRYLTNPIHWCGQDFFEKNILSYFLNELKKNVTIVSLEVHERPLSKSDGHADLIAGDKQYRVHFYEANEWRQGKSINYVQVNVMNEFKNQIKSYRIEFQIPIDVDSGDAIAYIESMIQFHRGI